VKVHIYWIALMLVSVCLPAVHAQEYGKIRALDQRAAHVIKQRNDFVVQVLTSYSIPHERNEQGAVVRIKMEGRWLVVSTVEIVPVLRESADKKMQVTAHELLFYTADGILYLLSELTIH
jgi:maltodextrin utilization protein YvdJ